MSNEPRDRVDPFAPQSLDDYLQKTSGKQPTDTPYEMSDSSRGNSAIDLTDDSPLMPQAPAPQEPPPEFSQAHAPENDAPVQPEEPPVPAVDDATSVSSTEEPPVNRFAIASLISAPIIGVLGIVFGHIANKQIREREERGTALALVGTGVGYVVTALTLLAIIGAFADTEPTLDTTYNPEPKEQQPEPEPDPAEQPDPSDLERENTAPENDEYVDPWVGTELEEFCEMLFLDYEAQGARFNRIFALARGPDKLNSERTAIQ